jgi:hypothetical protein
MKKKPTVPSAFEDAFKGLGLSNTMNDESVTDVDKVDTFADVDPKFEEDKPGEETLEDGKEKKGNTDVEEIPEEVLNRMNANNTTEEDNPADNSGEETHTEDPNDEEITEAQQVSALFDAVADKFGWSSEDIDEETRPVTVEGLVDYLHDVVEENSVPEYADERIQQLDEYVKSGGRFEDFYTAQQQQMDYESIDLDDESNQRTVIRDLLRSSGYNEE